MASLDIGQDVGFNSADTFIYSISLNLQNNLISRYCYLYFAGEETELSDLPRVQN